MFLTSVIQFKLQSCILLNYFHLSTRLMGNLDPEYFLCQSELEKGFVGRHFYKFDAWAAKIILSISIYVFICIYLHRQVFTFPLIKPRAGLNWKTKHVHQKRKSLVGDEIMLGCSRGYGKPCPCSLETTAHTW